MDIFHSGNGGAADYATMIVYAMGSTYNNRLVRMHLLWVQVNMHIMTMELMINENYIR